MSLVGKRGYVKTFLVIVSIALLLAMCTYFANDPTGVTEALTNSNKRYLAYGFAWSGGGGPGWCGYSVNIRKLANDYKLSDLVNREGTVFSINTCEDAFTIRWKPNEQYVLEITCKKLDYEYHPIRENSFREIKIYYLNCPK